MKIKYKITATVMLPILLILFFVFYLLYQNQRVYYAFRDEIPQSLEQIEYVTKLEQLTSNILYYGEVLSQSTRNYVFTGESRWLERYNGSRTAMDLLLKTALASADKHEINLFAEVADLQEQMEEIERQAIDLTSLGESEAALRLLESASYQDLFRGFQHRISGVWEDWQVRDKQGLQLSLATIRGLSDELSSEVRQISIITAIILLLIALLAWWLSLLRSRAISEAILQLKEVADKVSQGQKIPAIAIQSADEIGELSESFRHMLKEIAESQARLENLYQEAGHANLYKDYFLATLSHELRSPASIIVGWAELLKKGEVSEDQKPAVIDIIHRNARLQNRLIQDILEVSNILKGKVPLEIKEVNILEPLDAAIQSIQAAADAKSMSIRRNRPKGPLMMEGDPLRLQQIFWNLLSNLVKIGSEGDLIKVFIFRHGKKLVVQISDHRSSMDMALLPPIIDPLVQDESTLLKQSLEGLSLAIARHLTEAQGGKVNVKSHTEQGQELTYTVAFPLRQASPQKIAKTASSDLQAERADKGATISTMLQGCRILVVDDSQDILILIRAILEQQGAIVETAESAAIGFEKFQEFRPDVIISDIGMPGIDGYELMQKIRQLPHGRHVPAAALSAHALRQDRILAKVAGYQIHIAKPVRPKDLVKIISELIHNPTKLQIESNFTSL